MTALLFWLGIAGLVFDWRYVAKGGQRPTSSEKRGVWFALAACAMLLLAMAVLGASAEGLGAVAVFLVSVLLALWSARRYLIRRRAPVNAPQR